VFEERIPRGRPKAKLTYSASVPISVPAWNTSQRPDLLDEDDVSRIKLLPWQLLYKLFLQIILSVRQLHVVCFYHEAITCCMFLSVRQLHVVCFYQWGNYMLYVSIMRQCCMFLTWGNYMLYVSIMRQLHVVCFYHEAITWCMFLSWGNYMLYVLSVRNVKTNV